MNGACVYGHVRSFGISVFVKPQFQDHCLILFIYFAFLHILFHKKVAGKEPTISLNRICVRSPQLAEQECKGDFEFCQSCDTDLCNSAPQYGPVAALVIAIPMAIAKIFLF